MDQFINKLYMNAFLAGGAWLEEVGYWEYPALEGYMCLCIGTHTNIFHFFFPLYILSPFIYPPPFPLLSLFPGHYEVGSFIIPSECPLNNAVLPQAHSSDSSDEELKFLKP